MLDDDLIFSEHTVQSLFARWKHEPNRIVGLTGRNFIGKKYLYPKHCCRHFEQLEHECTEFEMLKDQTLLERCSDYVPQLPGRDQLTMNNFCDSARLVLPKVSLRVQSSRLVESLTRPLTGLLTLVRAVL